ncbi:MAG: hypothetical protein HC925_06500 [Coleofasciculaceae cyanobacterium SM2_3_26]|nr:hypothetical protein [Coleofasciculaceae cyanobacterium SM2_3_26]
MANAYKHTDKHTEYAIVDLGRGVFVRTVLPDTSIPALRSGFAGYPANPRWNAVKVHAWKVGRQWRKALACGEMVVRGSDAMLVSSQECDRVEEGSRRGFGALFRPDAAERHRFRTSRRKGAGARPRLEQT